MNLPNARIRYGESSPVQYADLRLPSVPAPATGFPTIIFVHGGGWLADWTNDYAAPLMEALTEQGFATWNIEFRRIGNRNGGYPEIFRDVGLAADHLREVAKTHPINTDQVVALGHSTGGHLALWLAGRRNIPSGGILSSPDPLTLKGVVSLGGVNDLRHSLEMGGRFDILELLGASTPSDAAELFAETSPACLLPFGVPQVLIVGSLEDGWRREMTKAYAQTASKANDHVRLVEPDGLDHFDVVDVVGPAVSLITGEIMAMLLK